MYKIKYTKLNFLSKFYRSHPTWQYKSPTAHLVVKESRAVSKYFKAEVHVQVMQLSPQVGRQALGRVVTHLAGLGPQSHLLIIITIPLELLY